ncbi:MAG: hypothetical protein HYZ84_07825 [Candidatus Omnitrophica bacterium]|nr:hypothetical protein [Candidatus Omnitrophota bacterium]
MNNETNTNQSIQRQSPRSYKRWARNIIIHKPMQREFTMVIISLLMISCLAIGYVIHETMREAAFGGGFHFGKINPYEVLSEIRYLLILRVTSVLFATLLIVGAFGVFFLHRVAGPVHRFRGVLLRLNDGEIPAPVKLREGDFFTEVAVEINRLLEDRQLEQTRNKELRSLVEKILSTRQPDLMIQSAQELKAVLEKNKIR